HKVDGNIGLRVWFTPQRVPVLASARVAGLGVLAESLRAIAEMIRTRAHSSWRTSQEWHAMTKNRAPPRAAPRQEAEVTEVLSVSRSSTGRETYSRDPTMPVA